MASNPSSDVDVYTTKDLFRIWSPNLIRLGPEADGVYMLWRSGDLQDTMVDAKRFFELSR